MNTGEWRYYNHAAVPACAPHEEPNLIPIKDGSIWKLDGRPLFARWVYDYDTSEETEWWYCVLDKPFDISAVKSSKRYKINKGIRYFEVKKIEPMEYVSELLRVQIAAFNAYPEKYRPKVDKFEFEEAIKQFSREVNEGTSIFYGAFFRETNELCGYHIVSVADGYQSCNIFKSNPEYEKYQINAALVYKWIEDTELLIKQGGYIENGTRTINHETSFQDYLEYYFGFRKVYCRLGIKYRPTIDLLVKCLWGLRYYLVKLDKIGIIHQINAVLKMEEISRVCQKNRKQPVYGLWSRKGINKEKSTKKDNEWIIKKERISIRKHGMISALYWNLITCGNCSVYSAYPIGSRNSVHESFVIHRCYKFPFMKKGDVEIGPCTTHENWRGKGIYPTVLNYILKNEISENNTAYMVISSDNVSSISGVTKAGFELEGKTERTKISKVYRKLLI